MVASLASSHCVGGATRPGCCEHAAARAAIACALALFLLAGCYKRSVLPQSEGHITTPAAKPVLADVPPPARVSSFVPEPTPAPKVPTYSVVVNEVPVKELLLALARDTRQNIDIHPGLSGLVSMNAINETLPAILDRVAKQVNMRHRIEGNTIIVSTDTPYMKTYKVNYVNMTRDTTSSIGVSGQIEGGGPGGAGAVGGSAAASSGALNASNTVVKTESKNDFWATLRDNIRAILASTRSQTLTSEDRAQRAEAQRTAREERLQQAEAVARAGTAATQLFSAAFGTPTQQPSLPGDARDDIIVNAIAGTISVLANEKQHALVQQHLDSIAQSTQRQVLIEATIAEVTLSDQYQAGIDWQRLAVSGGITFTQLFRSAGDFASGSLAIGYANKTSDFGNISATVQLLNKFGNTRVLSSPKLMTLNNQTALLKVVDNVVYFSIQAQQGVTTGTVTTAATFTTTALTVPVGMVMSLTPQINENGQVTLTVRPTVSRVLRFKNDPNPNLCDAARVVCVVSQVPEIQIREMESVLQLVSGQTAILGGLMKDDIQYDRNAVPGAGDLPNLGELFGFRNDKITKTELVIFLRSTVITNPSLDSDELKFFQRLLPQQTETPTHTIPGEKAEKAGASK